MYAKQLYMLSYNYLLERAEEHSCFSDKDVKTEIEKYFRSDEPRQLAAEYPEGSMNAVLHQMLFHAQNATFKQNVIQFGNNLTVLKEMLCGFDPKGVLDKYDTEDEIYDDLCNNIPTCRLNPDPQGKMNSAPFKYAKTILSCCRFLLKFENVDALKEHLQEAGTLAPVYLSFELEGFGIALACDFLKEFDGAFDFPKPDVHITALVKELSIVSETATGAQLDYLSISALQELAQKMSEQMGEHISCYRLDRLWWLICTESFFLHDNSKNTKSDKRDAFIRYLKDNLLEEYVIFEEREDMDEVIERFGKWRKSLGEYPCNVLNGVFGEPRGFHGFPKEEVAAAVDEAFASLPTGLSLIAKDFFAEGLGHAEIAEKHYITVQDANIQLGKMLRALRHPSRSKKLARVIKEQQ